MDQKALFKISYGMYIICSSAAGKMNGQIANTVFQVTSEPATIAVSLNKSNLTHELVTKSKVFTVSVLAKETPLSFIGQFGFKSGRDQDKLAGVKYKVGELGAPFILDHSIACLEAEVINTADAGTHTIFIGRVKQGEVLNNDAEPLTYAYYHEAKRGTAPASAPTYVKKEEDKKEPTTKKYVCLVCGYVYDPEKGDPDSGVVPGTAFADLPANWVCPVCGAGKEQFKEQ